MLGIDLVELTEIGVNIALWIPGSGTVLANAMTWFGRNYDTYVKPTIDRAKGLRPRAIKVKRMHFDDFKFDWEYLWSDTNNRITSDNSNIKTDFPEYSNGDGAFKEKIDKEMAFFEFSDVQVIDFEGINKATKEIDDARKAEAAAVAHKLDGMLSVEEMQAMTDKAKNEETNEEEIGRKSEQEIKQEKLDKLTKLEIKEREDIKSMLEKLGLPSNEEEVDKHIAANKQKADCEKKQAEYEMTDPTRYKILLVVPKDTAMGQIDFNDWEKKGFKFKIIDTTNNNREIKKGDKIDIRRSKKIGADGKVIFKSDGKTPEYNYDRSVDAYEAILGTIKKVPLTLGQGEAPILPNQIVRDVTDEAAYSDLYNRGVNFANKFCVAARFKDAKDLKLGFAHVDPIAGHSRLRTKEFADAMFDLVTKVPEEEGKDLLDGYYNIVEQGINNDLHAIQKEIIRREEQLSSREAAKKTFRKWLIISSLIAVTAVILYAVLTIAAIIFVPPLGHIMLAVGISAITAIVGLVLHPLKHLKLLGALGIGLGAIKVTIECQNQLIKTAKKQLDTAKKGQDLISALSDEVRERKNDIKDALEKVNALKKKPDGSKNDEVIALKPKSGDAGVNIICRSLEADGWQQNWRSLSLQLTNSDITGNDGVMQLTNMIIKKPSLLIKEINLKGNKIGGCGAEAIVDALKSNFTLTNVEFDSSDDNDCINNDPRFSFSSDDLKVIRQFTINKYIQKSFNLSSSPYNEETLRKAFGCKQEDDILAAIKTQISEMKLSSSENLTVVRQLAINQYIQNSFNPQVNNQKLCQAFECEPNDLVSVIKKHAIEKALNHFCLIGKNFEVIPDLEYIIKQNEYLAKSIEIVSDDPKIQAFSSIDAIISACSQRSNDQQTIDHCIAFIQKNKETFSIILGQLKNNIRSDFVFKLRDLDSRICKSLLTTYLDDESSSKIVDMIQLIKSKSASIQNENDRVINNNNAIFTANILKMLPGNKFTEALEKTCNGIYDDERLNIEGKEAASEFLDLFLPNNIKDDPLKLKVYKLTRLLIHCSKIVHKKTLESITALITECKKLGAKEILSKQGREIVINMIKTHVFDSKNNDIIEQSNLSALLEACANDKDEHVHGMAELLSGLITLTPQNEKITKKITKYLADFFNNSKNNIFYDCISDLKKLQKETEDKSIDMIIQNGLQKDLISRFEFLIKNEATVVANKDLFDKLSKELDGNYDLTKFDHEIKNIDTKNYVDFICKRNLMYKYALSNDTQQFIKIYNEINSKDLEKILSDIGNKLPDPLKTIAKTIASEALKDNKEFKKMNAEHGIELLKHYFTDKKNDAVEATAALLYNLLTSDILLSETKPDNKNVTYLKKCVSDVIKNSKANEYTVNIINKYIKSIAEKDSSFIVELIGLSKKTNTISNKPTPAEYEK